MRGPAILFFCLVSCLAGAANDRERDGAWAIREAAALKIVEIHLPTLPKKVSRLQVAQICLLASIRIRESVERLDKTIQKLNNDVDAMANVEMKEGDPRIDALRLKVKDIKFAIRDLGKPDPSELRSYARRYRKELRRLGADPDVIDRHLHELENRKTH